MNLSKDQRARPQSQSTSKEEVSLKSPSKINKEKSSIKSLADKYGFTKEEVIMIKKRFDKIAENNLLNKTSFRRGLGLLGLENAAFLCDRIFHVIDQKNTGLVDFEEFLRYMHTLIDGDITQKAKQSFRMLDIGRQGRLYYYDIEKIVYEMSVLWNSLTGSQVKPTPNYLKKIFNMFDQDKDGSISFHEFNAVYSKGGDIFGWFEYLNQEDNPIEFWLSFEDQKPVKTKEKRIQEQVNLLQDELIDCLFILQDLEESRKADIHESVMDIPSYHFQEKSVDYGGPSYVPGNMSSKSGDEDVFEEDLQPKTTSNVSRYFTFDPNSSKNMKSSTGLTTDVKQTQINPQKDSKDGHSELYNNIKAIQGRLNHLLEVAQSLQHSSHPVEDLNKINKEFLKVTNENYTYNRSDTSFLTQNNERLYSYPNSRNSYDFQKMEALSPLKKQSSQDYFFGSMKPNPEPSSPNKLKTNGLKSAYNDDSPTILSPGVIISESKQSEEAGTKHTSSKQRFQKNVTVFFGHENWNLVLNMMIGMRMALKSVSKIAEHRLIDENDYKLKVLFELIQQRLSSFDIKQACRFLEFAPLIFNDIRLVFGITATELLRSVGPESLIGSLIMGNMSSLLEQSSAGKSGSFFYYSEDGKFLLKTVSKKEFFFLKRILKPYHNYLKNHPNSLLIRIFGMYKMKFFETKKDYRNIYFIVMGNIFNNDAEIDVKYDLKGSLHGRTSRKPGRQYDKTMVLKDLDFNEDGIKIQLNLNDQNLLLSQIENDSKFLAELNINDYSVLVGINFVNKEKLPSPIKNQKTIHHSKTNSLDGFLASHGLNVLSINSIDKLRPSKPNFDCQSGFMSRDGKRIYYMGIIDILTEFNTSKRFEYGLKRTFIGKDVSCIPPQKYSERFLNYISSKFA